jgi:hypothetical protein
VRVETRRRAVCAQAGKGLAGAQVQRLAGEADDPAHRELEAPASAERDRVAEVEQRHG